MKKNTYFWFFGMKDLDNRLSCFIEPAKLHFGVYSFSLRKQEELNIHRFWFVLILT